MPLLLKDQEFLQQATAPLVPDLNNARLLITGGTGVFGSWLLEALIAAQQAHGINLSVTILTRNPENFQRSRPHLAGHPIVTLIPGDIRSLTFPDAPFDYIIHAAAESHHITGTRLDMADTILTGTRRILDLARISNPRGVLFVSSNAVYGRASGGPDFIDETCNTAPLTTDPTVDYDESKRMAEAFCTLYHQEHNVPTKIARCFPVVGPYLPLDAHFAIGNFLRDALRGGPIQVNGDGTAVRSYLYLADLAIWLLTILVKGKPGAVYNVGSDTPITIANLALQIANSFTPPIRVQVQGTPIPGAPVSRYVPSIDRARTELGLTVSYSLDQALARTIEYSKANKADIS